MHFQACQLSLMNMSPTIIVYNQSSSPKDFLLFNTLEGCCSQLMMQLCQNGANTTKSRAKRQDDLSAVHAATKVKEMR